MWICTVFTLFPNVFPGPLSLSVTGRAIESGLCRLSSINIRDYANDRHSTVDDTSYGGGGGMVIRADVLDGALSDNLDEDPSRRGELVYLSPRGKLIDQDVIKRWSADNRGLNLICGRFSGVDERILQHWQINEYSIGDYVLTNGDLAALIVVDACIRLLPGVLDDGSALKEESFGEEYPYLLEHPQYTKPACWKSLQVPDVLLSGNHQMIRNWRRERAKNLTKERRPDLWMKHLEYEGE